PFLEKLEDRILLTAEPTVTVDGPDSVDLGEQDVTLTLTFDNTSGDDTPGDPSDGDTGFVPFVNVILPTTGADGAGAETDDGITFDGASFLGTSLSSTVLVFDDAGEAEHPLASDPDGNPIVVTGTPGDTLVVLSLPFGSFAPEQVPVEIELTLDVSPLADVDVPLDVEVQGGFAFGTDPLDDPDVDPPIFGATTTQSITPTLLTLTKANDGAEDETATGPNFPRTWTITLDVADGQTLTDVVLDDLLPTNIHYLGNLTVSGGTGAMVLDEPAIGVIPPDDRGLQIGFDSVTGGSPVTVSFEYFVPDTGGRGLSVLNPFTGNDGSAVNDVSAAGDFVPLDPRDDPVRVVSDEVAADDVLDLRSIAVQKSVAVSDDQNVAGPTPGDTVTSTLAVQISDFFTMGEITLTDVLGDGLEFVDGSATLEVVEADGDSIAAGTAFAPLALTVNDDTPGTGETTLVFDVSAAMVAAGAADDVLVGDLVDGVQTAGTTAIVTYDALILDQFANPTDESEISQGDTLNNAVTVSASVRDNDDPTVATGFEESDTSAASITIPFGGIDEKTVVAINGVAPSADQVISAGDEVTFSVSYVAPIGSFEDLTVEDFLPQPVFDATEITTFVPGTGTATPPAPGTATFGAATTANFFTAGGTVPVLDVNAGSNSIAFAFSDVSIDAREEIVLEIVFTATVQDEVFSDGLLLTNQASITEENTNDTLSVTTQIAQFVFGQPELEITKGVIASDNGVLDAAAGPVAFSAPGSAGPRAAGTISSDALDATTVDADLSGVDAGDTVSFAIVVENTGSSPGGAFDITIQDTLPTGFEIGPGGLNLNVSDGAGTAIAFTGADTDLFGAGIELVDGTDTGALASFDATAGDNIVVVTYDLVVADTAGPADTIENTAAVAAFAAFNGGENRVPAAGLDDDAVVETLLPRVEKTLVSTGVGGDADTALLVGETAVFQIAIDLTEGLTEDLLVTDAAILAGAGADPDGGVLEILGAEILAIGTNLTLENALAPGDGPNVALSDGDGDGIADSLGFDFGDVTNAPDNDETPADRILIEVTARVNSDPATEA
ncbi:MAG: hypothetical protein AAFZ09_01940, partial [Pseudomonadota bacterium]